MPLPESVRKKAEAAANIIKNNADAKAKLAVVPPSGLTSPPVAPPAATPQPAPAVVPPAPAAVVETVESLTAKLAAQAAETDRLAKQVASIGGRASTAEKRANQLNADLEASSRRTKELEAQLQAKIESGVVTGLTDADRKLFGEDMLQVAVKVATEVAGNVVSRVIDQRTKPLADRFAALERMSEDAYNALIDYELPDFEAQNNDPKFIAWLHGADPQTKRTRYDLLQDAHGGLQGYRTVEIFRAYREGREIGARLPTPAVPAGAEGHLAPAAGSGTPPPPPDGGDQEIITRAQISNFYSEKRRGLWKGREAEARAFEQKITQALADRRVR